MNIVVFIKQVPDTSDIKWTENNTIDREGLESIINPKDALAIEAAVRIKEEYDAHITAVSMGPFQADAILRLALAMGVDDAVLLSDRRFSGADTVATSRVLAKTIQEKLPNTDLIIFGQVAIDGETGQTGPSVASHLDLPQVTYVSEIIDLKDNVLILKRETEKYSETVKATLPLVICINNYNYEPRLPRIGGYIKSQRHRYETLGLESLNLTPEETGLKGSPTYVGKVFKPENERSKIVETWENSYDASWHIKEKIVEFLELKNGK